ncbi:MAG: hypothetical protein M3N22_07780, partial [Acidobacteriota bacterium]|nr:hypothetical protein [Acidobacteriota bacterium]
TGVDAIGRPFTEHTSSLIINCHGCRYQSKHYVLKNMWVKLEVPHPETGHPPRVVRGRVAWIQRPRTVRQLFQVALELETPGNVWGIAFPPEDWFAFREGSHTNPPSEPAAEMHRVEEEHQPSRTDEQEFVHANSPDNLRAFPAPASTTDASLQLARQLARLVADAKQQIQAAAREAAAQAVSAEHGASVEQWDQKFAAARQEVVNETTHLIERIQQEADNHARSANAAAAEAMLSELPRVLKPQLEQMTRELTAQLVQEGTALRGEHDEQLRSIGENLRGLYREAEEVAARLKAQAEEAEARLIAHAQEVGRAQAEAVRLREETSTNLAIQAEDTEAHIAERAEAAARTMDEAARVREEALGRLRAQAEQTETHIAELAARAAEETTRSRDEAIASQRQALEASANEIQEKVTSTLSSARQELESSVAREVQMAQALWQAAIETSLPAAQIRAIGGLEERANELFSKLQDEATKQTGAWNDRSAEASAELEKRLTSLRESLDAAATRLEFNVAQAGDSATKLENFSARLGTLQEQAVFNFHAQLDDVLNLHRNELHRRSESLFEEINSRIRSAFEEASQHAAADLDQRVLAVVTPHLERADDSVQRMVGGRALLDASLAMQQDRIRGAADEAFAESLSRFRENLGSAENVLDEAARAVTARNLTELEEKLSDIKHQAIQDVFKSAEWYEKKAQTHIQNVTDKAVEQAGTHLREKAADISSAFTNELDNSSRNFVGHTQAQMEDSVRSAFDRARSLFAEASETTSATFTDEIQRTGRQELSGFGQELQKSVQDARTDLAAARAELSQQVTAEQEEFLQRFRANINKTVETSVTQAHDKVQSSFSPLLDSWKSMTDKHQAELRNMYARISEQAAEQHRRRLENVSNQWMLATVTALDHQSREVVAGISASAEEKLRETCTQVFAGIGETLQERLQEIARSLTPPIDPNTLARAATPGS